MMRAWAAISAAAVLVALPVSAQRAAGESLDTGTTGAAGVSTVSTVPAAATSSVADIGVVLWLSVAVVAALAASLVLRHSRRLIAQDAGGLVPIVASVSGAAAPAAEPLSFVRPERTGVTSPLTGR